MMKPRRQAAAMAFLLLVSAESAHPQSVKCRDARGQVATVALEYLRRHVENYSDYCVSDFFEAEHNIVGVIFAKKIPVSDDTTANYEVEIDRNDMKVIRGNYSR